MPTFHPPISPLFVPASRPDRIAKAAGSGADAIILDLEDAVPAAEKDRARRELASVGLGDPKVQIWLRVNGCGTRWHQDDLRLASTLPVAAIMLPKAEWPSDVEEVAQRTGGLPLVPLIESAVGVARLPDLAQLPQVAQLAFGSIDFAVDIGAQHCRDALSYARAALVLWSRAAGLAAPLDGVTVATDDHDQIASDSRHAVSLGFGGKLAIHPAQIPTICAAFRPTGAEIAWARKIVSRMDAAGGAAVKVDGAMVDAPVLARAQRLLGRAGPS